MPGEEKIDPMEELLEEHIGRQVVLITIAHAGPLRGLLNQKKKNLWCLSLRAEGPEPAKDLFVRTEGIMAMATVKDAEGGIAEPVVHLS
jgi:hypothetical protein